ncbi:MAG: holo-ACP synthase [Nitrospiraceae bacterium]|nr:MAG: holo-ACP synthase [Nitrospiraceae bacterium]
MIYGIGIDLVKIERMKEAYEKWGIRFFERVFTDNEIAYCFHKKVPYPSLAVRFAAKEALIKAIGSEIAVNMKDIEIISRENGKPFIEVKGNIEKFFLSKGIKHCHISLSHEREYGIGSIVLEV